MASWVSHWDLLIFTEDILGTLAAYRGGTPNTAETPAGLLHLPIL